jgi:hypothetical protein
MTDVIDQLLDAIVRLRAEGKSDPRDPGDRARNQALALIYAAVESLEWARQAQARGQRAVAGR